MSETREFNFLKFTLIGGATIFCILIVAGFVIPSIYPKPNGAGEFGDMFGVVNALFSGLAFWFLIAAILLQKNELELQRQELKETRQELAGQREQLSLQNATFRQQAFDSTFFHMLSLHHQIVDAFRMDSPMSSGRECFQHLRRFLRERIASADKSQCEEGFMVFYTGFQQYVGHYFRNLYNIVKFVDQRDVDDKKFYTNLIRAQLSSDELFLLFYNCNADVGHEFKPLVERYTLLKHLPNNLLPDQSHRDLYEPGAYE